MKIEYADSFTNDLRQTFEWIAERAPVRAATFPAEVRDICENLIATRPGIGSRRPKFGTTVRAHHAASINRTIYYRVDETQGTIFFIRLVYRQNITREDFPE